MTWRDEAIDGDWWRMMLSRAASPALQADVIDSRAKIPLADCSMPRTTFIPGLVVDRYG